ncbi:hypothetical protein [Tumidithrix helvetica]|uniref:hypothetical protein n=1 Tax=Tumidithrix helvetica TaxID=3457545 RepID=UPI003CC55E69
MATNRDLSSALETVFQKAFLKMVFIYAHGHKMNKAIVLICNHLFLRSRSQSKDDTSHLPTKLLQVY